VVFIKPGAETKTILKQSAAEVDNLLISDFIIVSCGSNDIGRAKLSEVFSDIIVFIKKVTHTEFILLTVPIRHDPKGANTSINKEITKFNRKLCKLEKLFSHLSVFVIEENKQFYTKYGLHLNGLGKKIVSISLTLHILLLIKKANNLRINIIPLGYYEDLVQITNHTSNVNHSSSQRPDENIKTKRIRKKPVTKTNYFMGKLNLTNKSCNQDHDNSTYLTKFNGENDNPCTSQNFLKIYEIIRTV
jgi:hypothetical protein